MRSLLSIINNEDGHGPVMPLPVIVLVCIVSSPVWAYRKAKGAFKKLKAKAKK